MATDEVRLEARAGEEGSIDAGVIEPGHRLTIQPQCARRAVELSTLETAVAHGGHPNLQSERLHHNRPVLRTTRTEGLSRIEDAIERRQDISR